MMNYYGNSCGWETMMPFGLGFGIFGLIFMILWWALIIWVIVAFVRWAVRQGHGWKGGDKSAMEILKERYAKGDITKDEYDEMKKELEK